MEKRSDSNGMLFSVEELQRWRWRNGKTPGVKAPGSVILCLQPEIFLWARKRYPVKPVKGLLGDFFLLKNSQDRVGLVGGFGLGSPVMAMVIEEYASFGVQRFISIGVAGSLQPELHPGDVIVCEEAYREEGTSWHYLPPSYSVKADSGMLQRICKILSSRDIHVSLGASWTTDAPYRETHHEANLFRKEGVLVVEMETAALYAAARSLKVQAAAVLIAADRLLPGGWEPPKKIELIAKSQSKVLEALIPWLASNEFLTGEAQ